MDTTPRLEDIPIISDEQPAPPTGPVQFDIEGALVGFDLHDRLLKIDNGNYETDVYFRREQVELLKGKPLRLGGEVRVRVVQFLHDDFAETVWLGDIAEGEQRTE